LSEGFILLVEDREDDIELTRRAFVKAGITNEIVVVRDGLEAVEFVQCTGRFFERNPADVPALILLDIKLPQLSGIQVLESIRRQESTKRVPVVMMTSSNEARDLLSCYDGGANSCVRKPVVFSDFAAAVRQVGEYWLSLNQAPPRTLPQ
jgi:two-component system response regulator